MISLAGPIKHPTLPPVKRWKPGRPGGGRGRGAPGPAHSRPPGKNVLPSKFLLGGNINDPLNLNSLNDERISRVVNAVTPESSPLPTPVHRKEEYKIEVLIPPNISDPLNLNAEDDSDYEAKLLISPLVKKKKVRVRKRPRKPLLSVDLSHLPGPVPELEAGHEGDISETDEEEPGPRVKEPKVVVARVTKDEDNNVEPAREELPQAELETDVAAVAMIEKKPSEKKMEVEVATETVMKKKEESKKKPPSEAVAGTSGKFKPKNEKFQYGNYNQYYGYRNPGNIEDMRLQHFKPAWFEDKEVKIVGFI